MREVEVTRRVQASPATVDRLLSPADVLAAEGSFDVQDVSEEAGETRVTVGGFGLTLVFGFEALDDGLVYHQIEGPLETLRTTLTHAPEGEGTRLTARSTVAIGGPSVLERVAAWKRRGELRRALASLAEASEPPSSRRLEPDV